MLADAAGVCFVLLVLAFALCWFWRSLLLLLLLLMLLLQSTRDATPSPPLGGAQSDLWLDPGSSATQRQGPVIRAVSHGTPRWARDCCAVESGAAGEECYCLVCWRGEESVKGCDEMK